LYKLFKIDNGMMARKAWSLIAEMPAHQVFNLAALRADTQYVCGRALRLWRLWASIACQPLEGPMRSRIKGPKKNFRDGSDSAITEGDLPKQVDQIPWWRLGRARAE
jgi:hypothetical protein